MRTYWIVDIPEPDIDHFGDCDVHGGVLCVALKGGPLAGVGDLDLGFQGSAPLGAQGRSCLCVRSTRVPGCCTHRRSIGVDVDTAVAGCTS
jgi:hypothetical protein